MNERIEELAKECNILGEKEFAGKIVGFNYGKFAELIVKECCEVINEDCNLQFNEGIITNLGGLNQARELIKQHFGVEE